MFTLHESLLKAIPDNTTDITVRIISGGCAGSKIAVTLRKEADTDLESFMAQWIIVWYPLSQAKKLEWGLLSVWPKGYLFTHPDIASRCGCATSFSFEKKGKIPSLHVLKDLKKRFTNHDNES